MATTVNVRTDFAFQVRVKVPGSDGVMRDATAGEVTGLKLRLSASEHGAAINAAVDNLAAAERAGNPAIQYVQVDTALLVAHVLPLGVGASFWAVWSKAGDMDKESIRYVVADGHRVA